MQEEVENRTLTLIVSSAKFTGRTMQQAISRYMNHRKAAKAGKSRDSPVIHKGKQTVKQLTAHGQQLETMELNDSMTRQFDRVARKYGVDYAVRKDRSESPPKYLIFFKARDKDSINAAFREFYAKSQTKSERPSVLKKLRDIVVPSLNPEDRGKRRERER